MAIFKYPANTESCFPFSRWPHQRAAGLLRAWVIPRAFATLRFVPLPGAGLAFGRVDALDGCYRDAMIRAFLTVSTGTLGSRLLGFVRDAMIAALLGTGPVADAFLAAFQLVNVIRRLLTEGALNAALVPVYLRLRETEGTESAARFAGRVLGTVSVVLAAVTLLLGLAMPLVMTVLMPG